jgi:hypothetical protein
VSGAARAARRTARWTATARRRLAARVAAALLLALGVAAAPVSARVLLTQSEALALAFQGCEVRRETLYLPAEQVRRARELAGVPVPSALVPVYRGVCEGRPSGAAYFDTHTVRTLPETIMVVVDAAGRVARVEVLSFQEPPDYLPREAWYDQLEGRPLDPQLQLRRAVRPVTGATLTARATTDAVRRVLAIHAVTRPASPPAAQGPSTPGAAATPPSGKGSQP